MPANVVWFHPTPEPRFRRHCPRKNKSCAPITKPRTHSHPPSPATPSTYICNAADQKSRWDRQPRPSPSASSRARPPRRRLLRRRAAPGIGAPRAGAPASLSAARRAPGDFGRPLAPLRPKTSKIRASAQRARFLRVCRVDALAPMTPRQCFDKPTSARAPLVAPRQRLVRPPGRALASRRSTARARVTACRPGGTFPDSTIPAPARAQASGSTRLVGSGPRIHRVRVVVYTDTSPAREELRTIFCPRWQR